MSNKVNKFKVGDEIVRVSHGGVDMPLGSVWIVNSVTNGEKIRVHGIEDIDWLSFNFELANEETNTSQNESIKKTLYSPLTVQQAGDHYKKKGIQPIEYGLANNLSFPQVNVVKYITRHEDKNGLDDLAKSIHYHFFEALRVYGEEGTHELRNKVLSLLGIEQGVFK